MTWLAVLLRAADLAGRRVQTYDVRSRGHDVRDASNHGTIVVSIIARNDGARSDLLGFGVLDAAAAVARARALR